MLSAADAAARRCSRLGCGSSDSSRALIVGASRGRSAGPELQRTAPGGVTLTALDVGDVGHPRSRRPSLATIVDRRARRRVQLRGVHERRRRGVGARRGDGHERRRTWHRRRGVRRARRATAARLHRLRVRRTSAQSPYPTERADAPLNVYGATKLEGERRVLGGRRHAVVVRTAWLHSGVGANFVKTAVACSAPARRCASSTIRSARRRARAIWRRRCGVSPTSPTSPERCTSPMPAWPRGTTSPWPSWTRCAPRGRLVRRAPPSSRSRAVSGPPSPRRPAYSVLDKHDSWRAIGFVPPHWREGVVASTHELLNA